MLPGTSPNDPVFFLHHCYVDKIWTDWQLQNPTEGYLPETGGPAGHNVGDAMYPWSTTPADMLNHRQYHLYDTDPPAIVPQTSALSFEDVPEGETTYRAVGTLLDVANPDPLALVPFETTPVKTDAILETLLQVAELRLIDTPGGQQ